jgi:undecaprenyl-diphosphatase
MRGSGAGLLLVAVLLGIVEGTTEFVPVSSTGHLILVGHWLAFPEASAAAFNVFIQLGAVFALLGFYRERLWGLATALPSDPRSRALVAKVTLAFVPAALAGLMLHEWIVEALFAPVPVAIALAVGGAAFLVVDGPRQRPVRTATLEDVTWGQALLIGVAQVAALWPGMSRSGATIIGGLGAGLSRTTALEFSFFLAMPTLGAASLFALWQSRDVLTAADAPVFAVGLGVSFVVSWVAIAGLLRYVRSRDLRLFGWYRLALAAVIVAHALIG